MSKTTMKVEVVFLPVSDTDRSIAFYSKLGWKVDMDSRVNDELRFVQMTPPGSACSFAFGEGITENSPGTSNNVMMVVDNTADLIEELRAGGVDATDADEQPWGIFTTVTDPDGNLFTFQQLVSYDN